MPEISMPFRDVFSRCQVQHVHAMLLPACRLREGEVCRE